MTKQNEIWTTHTLKGHHSSSMPAKTYCKSMCRCNNIVIHLGWHSSSHVTCLATDLSDKSLSALATLAREALQAVSRQHSLLAVGQAKATGRSSWLSYSRTIGSTEADLTCWPLKAFTLGEELVKDFLASESYTMFFELISDMTYLTTMLEDHIHETWNCFMNV